MMGWGYGIMGWFGMMLILLAIIGAVIYAVIKLSSGNYRGSERRHDNSLEILNERFAKGEISEEEYRRTKEMIMKR
jgi:putative membrane protein